MAVRRKRRWLETPNSGVDSYAVVTHDPDVNYADATLKIADCDRRVSLYFNLSKPEAIRSARRKFDRLQAALDDLNEVIEKYEEA